MFFGEETYGIGVRVVLPRQHEVDEKWNKANGQQNVAKRSASGRNYAGQTGRFVDLNRDWVFVQSRRSNYRSCAFFNFFGLCPKTRDCGMDFARVFWQLGGEVYGSAIEKVNHTDSQCHHQQYRQQGSQRSGNVASV